MAIRDASEMTEAQDLPKPWWYFFGGFTVLSLCAAVAAGLFVQFWANRPINYAAHTEILAGQVEEVLVGKFVPAGNINRSAPTRRESDTSPAYWNFYRFDVELPRDLSPDALKDLVRDELLLQSVSLLEVSEPGAAAAWSLTRGEIEFAQVILHARRVEDVAREDLRERSLAVADALERALRSVGTPEETLVRSMAADREDPEAQWALTRFAAGLPPGLSPGDLQQQLWEALAFEGVSLSTERVGYGTLLAVRYGGRRFAEVLCAPPTPLEDALPPLLPPVGEVESLETAAAEAESLASIVPDIPPAPRKTPPGVPEVGPLEPPDPPPPLKRISPPKRTQERAVPGTTARVAIILDDGGNNRAHSERVLALDSALTLAILPHTPHGRSTALDAAALGFEVMLHMPMENDSKTEDPGPGKVLTSMNPREIELLLRDALASLVEVKGVNNHTGSKFTANREAMRVVLEVLREESLYFIDSWTGADTVAYALAREMGVPTAHRDVFLDHDRTAPAIRRQYEELLATAKRQGTAIGIGHFQSPHTLALLEVELPKLAEHGIELVHASELVQ